MSSFFLPASILWPAAGLAAQPPHLKEQSDEQMRLWRGVSTSWCNQLVDWEATPDLSRALRRDKSKRWSFLRKCDQIGSIFGGIDSTIMEASRQRELLNEVLLQVAFLEGQIAMLEGVKRRASMCQAFYRTFSIRERYIVPVSSNFLTQISCGIKTKCRKTRAMQRDFTIVDSLALRQCNTSMIPDTHSLKLLFPTRYYLSLNLLAFLSISVVLQNYFDKK